MPNPVDPSLGEWVLLVPQTYSYYMREQDERNVIGLPATPVEHDKTDRRQPHWEQFTSTLMHKGIGVMVVRDGQLRIGPSDWDSGD